MAKKTTNTSNSDRLIFSEVKERLQDQLDSVDGMDTKAGIALGFNGAILAALLNSDWFKTLPGVLLIAILLLICAVTALSLKAFLIKGYRKDPEPSKLIEKYQEKTEQETLGRLIKNFEECFNENEKSIEEKKKYLNWSFKLLALTVGVIALVAYWTMSTDRSYHVKYKNHRQEVFKHDRFR